MASSAPSSVPGRPKSPSESSSSSSSGQTPTQALDLTADDGWEDVDPDTEDLSFISLFDGTSFPDLDAMVAHDSKCWGFDLKSEVKRLGLDFYGCIRLVNYLRSEVSKGNQRPDVTSKDAFVDDKFLKPVLEDDALLFCLDDLVTSLDDTTAGAQDISEASESGSKAQPGSRVALLEQQLETLQRHFAEYRSSVEKTLDETWNSREALSPESMPRRPQRNYDEEYFDSYAYFDIHETMLKDEVRTSAYRDFIYDNKHLFAGRVVLDLGCGTGILSMFAAKAGAKHVYAVDNSTIIDKAREIIAENGLQDKITCVRGRIEDITLPPLPPGAETPADSTAGPTTRTPAKAQVDIIVSEWFGYCLLYENMLDSVLHARDTYLTAPAPAAKPPLLVPSHTTMHIAPFTDPAYIDAHITFWSSVYGFSMAPMLRNTTPYADVSIRTLPASSVAGDSARFKTLDLYTARRADLEFVAPFAVHLTRDLPDGLDGWVLWFDVFFLPGGAQTEPANSKTAATTTLPPDARPDSWPEDRGVAFTTGPAGKETHWMQGCLMIDRGSGGAGSSIGSTAVGVAGGTAAPTPLKAGQKITGSVAYRRSKANARELQIEVAWEAEGTAEKGRQLWFLR